MTKTTKIVLGIIVIVAVLVGGYVLGSLGGRQAAIVEQQPQNQLGGVTYDRSTLVGDVYQGQANTLILRDGKFVAPTLSTAFATTSTGAGTLTAANITGKSTILSTNAGALTLTLPASTTLLARNYFLPSAGDRLSYVIVNQGTALLTLAGGTGTLLQTASSTKTVNIGGSALLNCVRKTNTDIICLMSAGI